MTEFRVLLEGGNVLVVDIHVEQGEAAPSVDPRSFGSALLEALGMGEKRNQSLTVGRPAPRAKQIVRPPEPTAEEWLEGSSREALRNIADGR